MRRKSRSTNGRNGIGEHEPTRDTRRVTRMKVIGTIVTGCTTLVAVSLPAFSSTIAHDLPQATWFGILVGIIALAFLAFMWWVVRIKRWLD